MNTDNLNLFFKKMEDDNAMRDAFVDFAATFDVDLSELSNDELHGVSGGAGGSIILTVPSGSVRSGGNDR